MAYRKNTIKYLPIISPPIPRRTDAVSGVTAMPNNSAANAGIKNIIAPNTKDRTAAIKRKADRFIVDNSNKYSFYPVSTSKRSIEI